jgi:hypothetical protein
MQPPLEDEGSRLAVEKIGDRATLHGKVVVAAEGDCRRKVQSPREPGLDLMDAPALDLDRMIAMEDAQVIVDRLGEHRVGTVRHPQ